MEEIPIVALLIIKLCVPVCLSTLEIRDLDVRQLSLAQKAQFVHPHQNVAMEYVHQSVIPIEIVYQINCALKVFVKEHVNWTKNVHLSNSV